MDFRFPGSSPGESGGLSPRSRWLLFAPLALLLTAWTAWQISQATGAGSSPALQHRADLLAAPAAELNTAALLRRSRVLLQEAFPPNPEAALEGAGWAATRAPWDAAPWLLAAEAHLRLGNDAAARAAARQAEELQPQHLRTQLRLLQFWMLLGEEQEAARILGKISGQQPAWARQAVAGLLGLGFPPSEIVALYGTRLQEPALSKAVLEGFRGARYPVVLPVLQTLPGAFLQGDTADVAAQWALEQGDMAALRRIWLGPAAGGGLPGGELRQKPQPGPQGLGWQLGPRTPLRWRPAEGHAADSAGTLVVGVDAAAQQNPLAVVLYRLPRVPGDGLHQLQLAWKASRPMKGAAIWLTARTAEERMRAEAQEPTGAVQRLQVELPEAGLVEVVLEGRFPTSSAGRSLELLLGPLEPVP